MTRRPLYALLGLLALSLFPLVRAWAQDSEGDAAARIELPAVPGPVRQALLHGEYDAALEALAGLQTSRADDADFWMYLEAVALDHSGKSDAAIAKTIALEAAHPASPWLAKSRFRRAELHRKARRFEEAEEILEDAARALRGGKRQGELAAIYIEFADEASTPPETPRPDAGGLDYGRAFQLYAKVLELDAPESARDHALYRMAHCREELGQWAQAVQDYQRYLDELPEGARRFEAAYRKGRAQLNSGQLDAARRSLEDFLASTEDDDAAAVEAELIGDARFALAQTWDNAGTWAWPMAIAAYERYLGAHKGHAQGPHAAFRIPELYRSLGRTDEALAAYSAFRARPKQSAWSTETLEQDERLRMESLYLEGLVHQQRGEHADATARFEEYTRRYATGPRWGAAQQGIVDSAWFAALKAREDERFDDARKAYIKFMTAWPLDGRATDAQLALGDLHAEQGRKVQHADGDAEPHFRAAIDAWRTIVRKYPGSEHASRALLSTGILHELELGDLDAAIGSYRACTFGSGAGIAQQRLGAMLEPSLRVVTERTWRAHEDARIKVQLRNHEDIEVRIYALDLEAYFRKHLTNRRIEALDLDLIAADETVEVAVADYAQYAPLEQEITLPVEGPGVWAVSITAGEQRATTLVVRSDIDVIVKSSRREVFVFAQDMPAGAPAAGVSVLLALPGRGPEGGPLLKELTTDSDGVARTDLAELDGAESVQVFAVRSGHCAADGLALAGLVKSDGLQPRGLVYTDRSVYRPGDRVKWRAIVREVADGAYTFAPNESWRIEISDSSGRIIRRQNVALSAFGTLHGELDLAQEAPTGGYTVSCRRPDGSTFTSPFQVQQYQLRKIELLLDTERDVYYRGEEVEVTARADWYYGEPVANAPLRYRLPDGREFDARTDEQGEARFTFATRSFPSEGALGFQAWLPEEQVNASGAVYLALHGYRATLTSPGRVVLAGEPFSMRATTTAPSGDPVGRPLTLTVLKRTSDRGRWIETEVGRYELATSEEDGTVEQTLQLDGGHYVVRAQGEDRFGNPVIATADQFVSGDDDTTRLRILTDRTSVKVGETVTLDLHDRAGPGLALLTFEAERILSYRLVRIAEGSNAIEFAVDGAHFPNITVSAALMQSGSFHAAQASFAVARELIVQLRPERDVYGPGEEALVEVIVTDQNGDPVEAELSLAVVDDALFQSWPDSTPDLRQLFESSAQRQAGLRTATSCTFRYDGFTAQISAAVLDEQERRAAQTLWDAERLALGDQLAQLQDMDVLSVQLDTPAEASLFYSLSKSSESLSRDANGAFGWSEQAAGELQGVAGVQFRGLGGGGLEERDKEVNRYAGFEALGREPSKRQNKQEQATPGLDLTGDTLFWTPAVVTDATGKAEVRFTLPERSTRWRLTSRGTSSDTLVGSTTATIRSRTEFFIELRLPSRLTQGDRPRLGARVHNLTGQQGSGRLTLDVSSPEGRKQFTRDLVFEANPVVEVLFDELSGFEGVHDLVVAARAEVTLGGDARTAQADERISVRPWGIAFADSDGGTLEAAHTLWLALPAGRAYATRELELFLGPNTSRVLIDEALGRGARFTRIDPALPSSAAAYASELLGVCSVLESLTASGAEVRADAEALRARAEGLIAALAGSQNNDGGWSWHGRGSSADEVTARVAIAIGASRERGFRPPADVVDRMVANLEDRYRSASQQQDERKAMLQHALASLDRGDFAALNRLHRERNSLSPAALAYACLALLEQDRKPMATELASLLDAKASVLPAGPRGRRLGCVWPTAENDAWNRSTIEMVALSTHALQRALPSSERIAQGVEYLMSHRPWGGGRARGMAIMALAHYERETATRADDLRLTVTVAGAAPQIVELAAGEAGRILRFPLEGVSEREVRVDITLEGRGKPHYAAVLRGFSRDLDKVQRDRALGFHHDPIYYPEEPRYAGRTLPTGFSVVTDFDSGWRNTVDHLALGRTTRVNVSWWRHSQRGSDGHLSLEIPLPAGCALLDGSFNGELGEYQLADGALVVPVNPNNSSGGVQFTLIGVVPGKYEVLPVALRSTHDPGNVSLTAPRTFTVLPRGVVSPDEYKVTPDEMYHRGLAQYAANDMDGAHTSLTALYADFEPWLRERYLTEAASKLLFLAIDRAESARIVEYFEVVKEKNPGLTIPFEKIVRIGEAYRTLGEFERAMLIFRATILETFGKDLKVAGTLEGLGEFAGATDALEDLWLAYPDAPTVVETYLTLADKLLAKAPLAARDESLKRAGRTRADLTLAGVHHLQRFMALYPEDPLAADAGLNLVAARLGLEDFEAAAELGSEFARRFDEPRYADAFLYTRAVAQWYLGQEDEALGALKAIAASEYTDESGNTTPSENRDLALYILGQIHHARREAVEAAEYYERVEHLFADAKEALLGFREKQVSIEEVTNARPGGKAELAITYRNIKEAELLVYGVDLMTLYLREKNLSNITSVNLSGISPTLRQVVQLGEGSDLRPQEKTAELALSEPGAYLVICRGEELFTSGLILVTDLELEVKEDPVSGRMRIQALDQTDGSYERDVDVRVIGSANAQFTSGETDPRGLFVADGVAGQATVIARGADGHYAFFRGATLLAQAPVQQTQQFGVFGADGGQDGYLNNVLEFNRAQVGSRAGRYEQEVTRERKGVQVQQVK